MTKGLRTSALAATLGLLAGAATAQTSLGTAFTYQGRLVDAGAPASGSYDFELRLFAAASGGVVVGSPVLSDDVAVVDGLFHIRLDFGSAAFAGEARWLEIAVRRGASTGSYTTLAPRQELTPSPNAVFSAAAPWAGLAGVPPGFADGIDDDSGGDITSVNAGTGLTGGASAGDATLTVDTTTIQARVSGTCPSGQSIRTVNANGSVVCEEVGWSLTGNAGTNPSLNFIGTTDAQPLVFQSNGAVALRLSRGPVLPNVVGGSTQNLVSAGVDGATIAGGGGGTAPGANKATDHYASVGGGYGNVAGNDGGTAGDAQFATVAGGNANRASGVQSAVGGGASNVASGGSAVVGGGGLNTASAEDSVVGGGEGNVASNTSAVVPGGYQNVAGGGQSFAAGFRARVRDAAATGDADGDEGTFVWADTAPPFAPFVSTGPNQFLVRASGGVGINTNAPAVPLDVDGVIRSRTGGFRFPDGTTQTTAATASAGDITAVNTPIGGGLSGGVTSGDANLTLLTCSPGSILKRLGSNWGCALDDDSGGTVSSITAGTGLTGGTITTSGTLGVAFAGDGVAAAASRSDHSHLGQSWTGDVTGAGLFVANTHTTAGASDGLYGHTDSTSGRGVVGSAGATAGTAYGVYGRSNSSLGAGVLGFGAAGTGVNYGVFGVTNSNGGYGVYGTALANGQAGVYGVTTSSGGTGVRGVNTMTTGFNTGVSGSTPSPDGAGVLGSAFATSGSNVGVYGISYSSAGTGAFGIATSTVGSTIGVWAANYSPAGYGLFGSSFATSGFSVGVFGQSASTNGYGGYFSGRVHVTGTLSKGGGAFKIDHPLDPENKYLYHSFVESPDMKNIYDGVVTTDAGGFATVEMPEWFDALNRDFRYQLTVIGKGEWAHARIHEPLAQGRFVIETSRPDVLVSWQVTGIRKDPFAEKHRIPLEEDKPAGERGKYLHPEAWGQAEASGVDHERRSRTPPLAPPK